jgi:hypothetical protein
MIARDTRQAAVPLTPQTAKKRNREEPGLQMVSGQNNVEARYLFAGRLPHDDDERPEADKLIARVAGLNRYVDPG